MPDEAHYGWSSSFPVFVATPSGAIRKRLELQYPYAEEAQRRAWQATVPPLQAEVGEVLTADAGANEYTAILEYTLPLDDRRPDVVLLLAGAVVVIELKGKDVPDPADLDQAAGYRRDLLCYHRDCAERPVYAVLVPSRARGYVGEFGGVHVAGPDYLDKLIARLDKRLADKPLAAAQFLEPEAYRPLPTLVQAARELFQSKKLRHIWQAAADTDPAVNCIEDVIREAATTKTRRLVLVTGVPGAGKTLVGLRLVHSSNLDNLAIARSDGVPIAPAVFLSGNGPLVSVLQYQMRSSGGAGQTFVRGVKDYVKRHEGANKPVPREHVLVFDEAQRAWDADRVASKGHVAQPRSEPELFVSFAERIPDWCVVVALVGTGQEIHVGEEGGLGLWQLAVDGAKEPTRWQVHGPAALQSHFGGSVVAYNAEPPLALDREIRFHLAKDVHALVQAVLDGREWAAQRYAKVLHEQSFRLYVTRDPDLGRAYLRNRYREAPDSRYGLLASSRDKILGMYGIARSAWPKTLAVGPWFCEGPGNAVSCTHLDVAATEFDAQGLELDNALVCWGTDFIRRDQAWDTSGGRNYSKRSNVRNPLQLRKNCYRVLLTRGRDGAVVFVPPHADFDETAAYLLACGFEKLSR
ncbi:MAG: DUF2075 domain-containing protein [Myxococcales bacterium]|nr:DUF2075 domain-containing protein [Myxococcales bacterium]